MATLILIRHGQSVANAERRFTLGPHEPLSEQGLSEADATGRSLSRHFKPVALYTSPFHRAVQTAGRIAVHLGLEPVVVEGLREQYFGLLHGKPYSDLVRREGAERWTQKPPGGESLEEVTRRAGAALDRIVRRHLGREVVVVSHGGVMAALRAHARGGFDRDPERTTNAGGFLLEYREERYSGPFRLPDADI